MSRLLVDTDAFTKLGIAGLLDDVSALFGIRADACARLAGLPHMLRRGGLPKLYGAEACSQLLPRAEALAVAPEASTLWLGRLANVSQIDPGEAQLFASAAEHGSIVVTGDKRSVIAMAGVAGMAEALPGRVASLEAVLIGLCRRRGHEHVRNALKPLVAVEDRKDKLVRICFSDGNPDPVAALRSYFNELRRSVAPLVLWELEEGEP